MGPVRQTPIQRAVKLFKKLCNYIICYTTLITVNLILIFLLIFPITPGQQVTLMWPRRSMGDRKTD